MLQAEKLLLTFRSFEQDGDHRRQVALIVPEREKVSGESSRGDVLEVADVLHVRGVLALARHPHYICLKKSLDIITIGTRYKNLPRVLSKVVAA